jgi:SAM-dependent methyltransferase
MPEAPDLTRLRAEYKGRARRLAGQDTYSLFNPVHLFAIQQRQRDVLKLLREEGFFPMDDQPVLEIGCGAGGVLHEYLTFGGSPKSLFGVDLIQERVWEAHSLLPQLQLAVADGQDLPFTSQSFNLVLQYTAFSSVLDASVKTRIAQDMLRVLRPGGMIVWYDFWLNPTNPQAQGISAGEIRRLFPGCSVRLKRVTLAPPIARRLVRVSWLAAALLEKFKIWFWPPAIIAYQACLIPAAFLVSTPG